MPPPPLSFSLSDIQTWDLKAETDETLSTSCVSGVGNCPSPAWILLCPCHQRANYHCENACSVFPIVPLNNWSFSSWSPSSFLMEVTWSFGSWLPLAPLQFKLFLLNFGVFKATSKPTLARENERLMIQKPGKPHVRESSSMRSLTRIFPLDLFIFFYVYECYSCMYVCVPHASLVPSEIRRGHRIPWKWNYGLWATM